MRNICRDTRLAKNMTQEDFGRAVGRTRQTIIKWEQDPYTIPLRCISKILALDTEQAI